MLREALGEVVFAAASDESRPILTGVLTRLDGDRMTLAAADNYRIAVRIADARRPVSPEVVIVVPGRSYAELMRILPDTEAADRDHGHARTRARSSSTSRAPTS